MFNFTMFAVVRVLCDKSYCSVVKKLSGRPHGEQTRLLFFFSVNILSRCKYDISQYWCDLK